MNHAEWKILSGYRETVQLMNTITRQLDRARRYRLPVCQLPEQARRLMDDIMSFETIMERIQDRQARNVLRCRFALGYTVRETADYLGMSTGKVDRIIHDMKPQ